MSDIEDTEKRYYGLFTIALCSFFTGPLTWPYMLYKNEANLEDKKRAKKIILMGLLYAFFVFAVANVFRVFYRNMIWVRNIFPTINVIIALLYYTGSQKKRLPTEKLKYKWYNPVLLSLISFLISIVFYFIVRLIVGIIIVATMLIFDL
jgi:hypothetical protein